MNEIAKAAELESAAFFIGKRVGVNPSICVRKVDKFGIITLCEKIQIFIDIDRKGQEFETDIMDYFNEMDADVFCLQETKCQVGQVELELEGYHQYWNAAVKKGYSGTAIFTKEEPLSVAYGIGIAEHDQEGRVITLEFEDFYMVTVYTPNAKRALERLDYREVWEDDFRDYLVDLDKKKPVVVCGDLNVAHNEIDIKNHKTNHNNAGFTDRERAKMTSLLEAGFVDTFRHFYPDKADMYSWWSYMGNARENNTGWRIDYFVTSQRFSERLMDAEIHMETIGSDHCPVVLKLK